MINEGDHGDSFYIVMEGEAEAQKSDLLGEI